MHVLEIPFYDPASYFSKFAETDYALLFDSNDQNHPNSRYSYILVEPDKTLKINNLESLYQLQTEFKNSINTSAHLPPFQGGWAGYLGYDLGFELEPKISRKHTNQLNENGVLGHYNKLVSFDMRSQKAWVICQGVSEREAQKFKKYILEKTPDTLIKNTFSPAWKSCFTQDLYEAAVQKIINYIYAGDIFQANMSQQFSAELPKDFDPFCHYLDLRTISPAPYSAYMNFGRVKISSASPELFLSVSDKHVRTMPIKGTTRSSENAQTLTNSEKDIAENVMIVDLLRNDLAKSCKPDSIKVPSLCQLETFSHVHHLVSEVTGTLKENISPLDLLLHAFPGGSITGAPKIRAMEIIDELETNPRGPYCGSLLLLGDNGYLESSITIRTLIFDGQEVRFNVGGGIVADSQPSKEYDETLAKAEGIFQSFDVHKNKQRAS